MRGSWRFFSRAALVAVLATACSDPAVNKATDATTDATSGTRADGAASGDGGPATGDGGDGSSSAPGRPASADGVPLTLDGAAADVSDASTVGTDGTTGAPDTTLGGDTDSGEGTPDTSLASADAAPATPDGAAAPDAIPTDGAPASNKSSAELIAEAVAAGALTDEQALVYRVFAVFKDPRLPPAYRGNDAEVRQAHVLEDVVARFASLSPAAQGTLAPFMMRPSYEGSWLNQRGAGLLAGIRIGEIPPVHHLVTPMCAGKDKKSWAFHADPSGKVKVWYDSAIAADAATALAVKTEVEQVIWPALFGPGLGLKAPPSDRNIILGCDGGDSRFDIYIVDMATSGERASDLGETGGGLSCKGTSSFTLISSALSGDELKATVAHELMHASQIAYDTVACHKDYGWLNDATANWAIDHVYGKTIQLEQDYADCFTKSPQKSLEDRAAGSCSRDPAWERDYGAYLFFQFMAMKYGKTSVKAALANTEAHATSLAAVNAALPKGFHDAWGEFSKTLYNGEPIIKKPDSFWVGDDMHLPPDLNLDGSGDLAGASEARTDIAGEIKNLATKFYRFTFIDPNTRSLLFANGFFDERKAGKAIRVFAFWKDAAGTWQEEEWSDYKHVGLCRDLKNQRVEELVIAISNGEWLPGGGGSLTGSKPTYLKRSNVGCWRFKGTSRMHTLHKTWSGRGQDVDSKLAFEIPPDLATLTAKHPLMPDTLRAGVALMIPAVGDEFTFQESYTNNSCNYSAGPVTFPISRAAGNGFIMMNPFPELEASDPEVRKFISKPRATYVAAGIVEPRLITQTITGAKGCGPIGYTAAGGLMITNDAKDGDYIDPPVALPNGELVGTFRVTDDTTCQWAFKAESEL